LERLFASFKSSGTNTGTYDPDDPESYEQYIQSLISDSRDYESDTLAADRDYAQKYYYALLPSLNGDETPYSDTVVVQDPNATYKEVSGNTQESANRSKYVSSDVRDAVMMMLPSLIRLFGASESPVELVPRTEAESEQASQATSYVNYVFWNDNGGFLKLYGAFKDALTVRTGFLKWWTDTRKEYRRKTFTYITAQQIQQILTEDPTAKIIEIGNPVPPPPPPPQMQPPPGPGIPGMGPPTPPTGGPPPGMGPPLMGPPPGGAPPGMGGPPPGGAMPPPQPPPMMGPMPPVAIYDEVVIAYEVKKPLIKVEGVPPEEMRLDRYARSFQD
jgi:hypothetical protein